MKRFSLLIVLSSSLLLGGCVQSDKDLVLDFINTWMEQRGIIDKDGKPTMKAMGVATGFGTTGDPRVDAAVMAGKTLKDIKETDQLVKKAEREADKHPPNHKEAKNYLDAAVNKRPNDWYYRVKREDLLRSMDNHTEADKDFQKALSLCGGSKKCEKAMRQERIGIDTGSLPEGYFEGGDYRHSCKSYEIRAENYEALAALSSGDEKTGYLNQASSARANLRDGRCVE